MIQRLFIIFGAIGLIGTIEACRYVPPPPPISAVHAQRATEITTFAQTLLGSPYQYTGISPSGFDCSGFTYYVYGKYGISIPHGSKEQINEGKPVALCDAAPADLLIFTGTDSTDRSPGHVGIVLRNDNCLVSFIHSSSNGGVKISTVERGYATRFLGVRRLDLSLAKQL